MFSSENPHVDKNRRAISGLLKEALDWERSKELERRKSLPKSEQKQLAEIDEKMIDKMQSSVG